LKKRIGILFGGKSGEHEVSVQSAESIRGALDKTHYDVTAIGIDKQGVWRLLDGERPLTDVGDGPAILPVAAPEGATVLREAGSGRDLGEIDLFFPIAHGTFGEDGSLQGLLRLLDAPFVGAGVLGSAVGMDKDVMKRLFRDAGLPVAPFVVFRDIDRAEVSFDVLASRLGVPFFVKPCNLGSSVGISKVGNVSEFDAAIDLAFAYDRKIVVEQNVEGREIECAVLGNDSPKASVVGEILVHADFYSYEAKYIDENGAGLAIPAEIDDETTREIQRLSVEAFQAVECAGMARLDFFLRPDGEIVLNEINTLPGFTRISMYPKLWEASGLPYPKLLDELVSLALETHAKEAALRRSFGD
jgi:D-alanine-D-alanine ligase